MGFCLRKQSVGAGGVGGFEALETDFFVHDVLKVEGRVFGVELKGVFALVLETGVVAEQGPQAAGNDGFALLKALAHVDAVVDTMRVGDDQRGAVVGLRLAEGFDHLVHVRAQGDFRHIHIAVAHGDCA